MSNVTDNMPPDVRAYFDALTAWNLAAVEWLGLDPESLVGIDATKDDRGYLVATWRSVTQQTPRLGFVHAPGASGDGEVVMFTGGVTLDLPDTAAFDAEVGPKPEMFTPQKRAFIKAMTR